jgi:Flp pilus assembly protein TadD
MGAHRLASVGFLVLTAGALSIGAQIFAAAQTTPSVSRTPAQTDQVESQPAGSSSGSSSSGSSSQTTHRKLGPGSSQTIRHTRIAEEGSQDPELTQAEQAIQKQGYAAAEPLLRKVVERDPANYIAWFDLGFVENGLGKTDDSIAAYRKSVTAKPDVFESNLNLGLQLAKTGQPEAERFLHAATQLKPTSNASEGQFRAWLSLAHVLEKSKPDEALSAYRQAVVLQPKDAEPHLAAGLLLEQENKFADAEQEYKQALALDGSSDALVGLASIYMRGHRFAEAEQYLRKVAAARPENGAAHGQLGRVLAAEGKNDDALVELQTALKLAPNDIALERDLADLYTTAGKNDQAEPAYRAIVAAHPDDAESHRGLGQALLRQEKFPEAQQEFLTTIKLKPGLAEAYGDLAFAASENKDYPLTIKALDLRAKLLPEIPITYFLRASAYDHLRNYKPAATNYRLFLEAAKGKYPDQEWQAKHRLIAIEPRR